MGGVSVVIPTHNRASLLPRALLSVRRQTRPPEEILVVDDGSTDGTAGMVASEFPEVRLLAQRHRGVSAARNRGIELASCEWIALLDSDDEWRPEKLERQLAALSKRPDHRVCHTDEIWIRNHRRVNPRRRHAKYGGWIFQYCLPLCAISPSSVLLHHSVLDDVGLFDESLPACEDYDLWLRLTSRYPVLYVDQRLVIKYGGHPDQLSRTVWGLDRFRIRSIEKILEREDLADEDRQAALRTLVDKLEIFAQGAAKRGREAEADRYRQKLERWRDRLSLQGVAGR